ncbi:MAG: MFS transporter [Gordonia sp. (in: high G+C Gram-positive bacteria)]
MFDPITAAAPAPASLAPEHRRRLLTSLLLTNLVLFATYAAVVVLLLPQQVSELDPAHKASNLAVVTTTSAFATLFAQPLVGAFSDRTRSRAGRRSPWLLFGAISGGLCTVALQFAPTLAWITLCWVAAQVLLNAVQAPLSAIISDRIDEAGRATASAFVGVGTAVGAALGMVMAGRMLSRLGTAYTILGLAMAVVGVGFVLLNRDRPSDEIAREPFHIGRFLRSFWVDPRKHPDFGWAFAGRFVMILGYQAMQTYLLYILLDYLHLTPARAGAFAGTLSIVVTVAMVVSTLIFGRLSDRLGRRKIFVFIASVVMAIAVAIPLVFATPAGMLAYSVVVGVGYGAYLAVDTALMVDVLPSRGDAGKDLGLLNVATNIPQALTPIVAAALLSTFGGNYAALFGYSAIAVLASSFLVLPIRSVR